MADDETASGIPVLSAFDKLKLSSCNNSNFITNRNNSCSIVNPSNRSPIDINSHPHSNSVGKVTTAASVLAASETSAVTATESLKCEKSISLPMAQFECNNKNTIMMFGNSEMNATFSCSSASEKIRDSGYSTFSPPVLSPNTTLTPINSTSMQSEKTIQILCAASDNTNDATPPLTPSLSVTSHPSLSPPQPPTTSSSQPSSLSTSLSSSISSPSLATITMVLPNSVNAGNFDVFSSPSSMSSPNLPPVQNKSMKFDANEVSIKMLKNGKCKTSVSVSTTVAVSASASVSVSAAPMRHLKPIESKSAPIICAPPPVVLPCQSNKFANSSASNKKSNTKGKNPNFGFPMLPGKLTNTTVSSIKQQSSNADNNNKKRHSSGAAEQNEQDTNTTTDDRNKKKRCADRYDSSESSDSGVATSLSCTDSSTASSDVSDPGSPYSPVLLGDDLPHKSIMPPQTILATTNGNAAKSPTTGAATPVQNVLKGGKQQQKHSQNKGITPQQPQKYGKAQISSQKATHHIWPWTSMGNDVATGIAKSNSNKNNKRHSQVSSTPTDGGAKKTRTTNSNNMDAAVSFSGAALQLPQIVASGKRLKAAAMEESQTKITGYFKSQMKAQIHQNGLKKDSLTHILPSPSSPSLTVTPVVPSPPSNSIVSAGTMEGDSIKYFNLLTSRIREEQEWANNPTPILPLLPSAWKKLDRCKPTKIAQVAPNLRKTTAAGPLTEKSPPKKNVPIAPRIADTRPKHEQLLPSPMKAPAPPTSSSQQPAVLLTAIRIPQPNQPPQLVPTSPHPQVTNGNCSKAQQNGDLALEACASKVPTGPSLYQFPMMPNLVQFPNLIAANVNQLTAARGNHHHPHPTATAQYFLNGTVFNLQQFAGPPTGANPPTFSMENGNQSVNTATVTTTGTAIEQQHVSDTKNTSSITATCLQEMLSNQFQTQQQQQQSVANAHNHRLHHHSQPVFMATTAGLLLNAASLPAMLGSNKQAMAIQSQQIPALQPIQGASAMMPGLSSIFGSHQEVAAQHLQQYKPEQVALSDTQNLPLQPATQIPPLSVSSSAFSKLGILKAGEAFTPSVHQVSATQPPPLVTISSGSQNVIVSTSSNKPSVAAKPYQKKGTQKKALPEPPTSLLLPPHNVTPPLPPISPPALAYPSLITQKEVQKRTEDLFDLLKNSKNETTLTPPPALYTLKPIEEESLHGGCLPPSSPLSSPDTPSNISTISDESSNLLESPLLNTSSILESSLVSTSLISAESSKLIDDLKQEDTAETTTLNVSEASTDSILATLTPTVVDTALADSGTLPKSAISPILSQPKTIRFPAKHESGHRFGPKGMRRHDGVCYWDKCNKKHESSSKLLDHMQAHHVNTQTGPFACLWLGCKVYGRESCSRRWLERHVLSHGGTKPFKCIVEGCGLRFGSQLALQKHVNGHFNGTENKDSTNKRTSDPPVQKLLRKNGKKLRYRRQPFSARMFDFFDTGIMEGLQHRLRQISTLTNGKNSITFQGEILMRRKTLKGIAECYVQWAPPKIISNEWLPESNMPYIKTLPINRMQPNEKTTVESLLRSAYRLPHSPNLFQSFHSLSRQNSQDSTTSLQEDSQSIATIEETTTSSSLSLSSSSLSSSSLSSSSLSSSSSSSLSSSSLSSSAADGSASRSSSIGIPSLSSISELPFKLPQMELRQKQSRKPPKRIQPS